MEDPDSGLHKRVLQDFTGRGHSQENEYFAHKLSSARMIGERSFGIHRLVGSRIAGVPCRLLSSVMSCLLNQCNIIGACYVLHNICEVAKDIDRSLHRIMAVCLDNESEVSAILQ